MVRPGDSVDIAWTSADESDVNLVQMRFIGPTGNWYYAYTNLNVHGTNSFTVDGDSFPNGRYRFDYLTVYDRAGNSTYYYASGQVERYPSGATPAPPASIDFAALLFWVGSIQVSPAAVTFTDKDGTAEDTYTVPSTDGVDYLVGDKVVPAGTYPGTGTVTVTAEARTDSVLASGAAAGMDRNVQGHFRVTSKSTDLNGDGKADLLARDNSGVLWLYPGNGKGSFLTRVRRRSGWNAITALT